MNSNPLLRTDVYKMGHMEQYCPGTDLVSAYLMARSDKLYPHTVFFGLQYYLQEYLSQPITEDHVDEFLQTREEILGLPNPPEITAKAYGLAKLGYWPVSIKAVPEGSVIPVRNALLTTKNTHPDFPWAGGFLESLLLKIWYPISVATCSFQYRLMAERYWRKSVPDDVRKALIKFAVHDFGYRGDKTEEGAGISGVAHLLSFTGSDTVVAIPTAKQYYGADKGKVMMSVPASEHSVMCSFGREDELEAFRNMLRLYPEGIVSIVSDTYNVWDVLTDFAEKLKPEILARKGKVVFRPDSGNPEHIINGNPDSTDMRERAGAIRLLDQVFGHDVNSLGYRTLNPKVGLIYGDAMYLERYERTLATMLAQSYAASELVIGVGGILRNFTRDSLGMALKATYVTINGKPREIEKDPVTDHKKKSHKGLVKLEVGEDGLIRTVDQCTPEQEDDPSGLLVPTFLNGRLQHRTTLKEIRNSIDAHVEEILAAEAKAAA